MVHLSGLTLLSRTSDSPLPGEEAEVERGAVLSVLVLRAEFVPPGGWVRNRRGTPAHDKYHQSRSSTD